MRTVLGWFLVFIGMMLGALVNEITHMRLDQKVQSLLATCEYSLPRNEHCVLVALPQSKD
jgi:hypothetical protein